MDQEDKVLDIFRKYALSVSDQFKADIAAGEVLSGAKPSFDDLLLKLKELDKALIDKAVKLIDAFKTATGNNADSLTEKCRQVISTTVEDFVKGI